jgi:sulfur-carrier protein
MAMVHLPRSLVEMFPGAPRHLGLEADTVAGVIGALDARWPGMSDRLCEPAPRIRPFINIFVDGQRAELATDVAPGSVVHIIPAVAGG